MLFALASWAGLAAAETSAPPAQKAPAAKASISATYKGSAIVIETSERLAGGINSLKWKGVELLNNPPEYLRGIGANVILDRKGLCYNPNDGGSRSDYFKPTSTSKLLSLRASGNVLETSKQMAFYLAPGQSDHRCGNALNTTALSDYRVERRVTIGPYGIANAIEFDTSFLMPEERSEGYFIPLGVHGAAIFTRFYSYDPETRARKVLAVKQRTQMHTRLPVIAATSDEQLALAIYSPKIPKRRSSTDGNSGYTVGNFAGTKKPATKLNCAFSVEPIQRTGYTFPCYLVIGTLADVTEGMEQARRALQAVAARLPLATLRQTVRVRARARAWLPAHRIPSRP